MTRTVTIAEAETTLDELIDQALAGDEIIIMDGGRPVAKLEPVAAVSGLLHPR